MESAERAGFEFDAALARIVRMALARERPRAGARRGGAAAAVAGGATDHG
jgi:hypothetical protein